MGRISSLLLATGMATQKILAKTIPIQVLDDIFEPNTTAAAVGDILEFHFMPHNHSVVMGEFTPGQACQPPKQGGFFSGFLPVKDGEAAETFRVQINDTNPIIYYCSQGVYGGGHCQIGMVGVVNVNDPSVLQKYVDEAKNVKLAGNPPGGPFGGTFAASSGGGGSTTSAPSTSPAAPTTSSGPSSVPTSGADSMIKLSLGSGILASLFAVTHGLILTCM